MRRLAERLGEELDLLRVVWLEANVLAGLGRTADAEVSFRQVRREFAARGLAVLASELVWIWLPGLLLTGLGVLARRLRSQDGR